MTPISPPNLLIHCDWSMHPARRWQAKATLIHGHYTAHDPAPVGPLDTFLARTAAQRGPDNTALLGFDFPIGLPVHYAQAGHLTSFLDFLNVLQQAPEYTSFYTVAKRHEEISHHRPFYPHGPGNKRQSHLLKAHTADDLNLLRRTCELAQPNRRAANPLFWTLGASQAGKGAIVGWRDLLTPALTPNFTPANLKLWPFQGTLSELLQPNTTVLAETYPTQYHHALLGESLSGKGKSKTRKKFATHLQTWAAEHTVTLTPELTRSLNDGFPQGDDAFDALLGLFGMIQLIQTYNPTLHEPSNPTLRNIEGWILGQPIAQP